MGAHLGTGRRADARPAQLSPRRAAALNVPEISVTLAPVLGIGVASLLLLWHVRSPGASGGVLRRRRMPSTRSWLRSPVLVEPAGGGHPSALGCDASGLAAAGRVLTSHPRGRLAAVARRLDHERNL